MGLDGNLNDGDRIVVDGPRRGDIRAETVQIEKDGSLVGCITAKVVRVAGRLEGDVDAMEFYAAKTARVRGSIRSDVVGIMPGASVAGCSFDTRRPAPVAQERSISEAAVDYPEAVDEQAGDLPSPQVDMSAAFARLAAQLAEVVAGSREQAVTDEGVAEVEAQEKAGLPASVPAAPSSPSAPQKRVLPKLFA